MPGHRGSTQQLGAQAVVYTKLSDGFCVHPKIVRVGNEAAGAFCRMLSYCGNHLSDGEFPNEMAIFFAANKESVLEALTEVALIRQRPDGSWLIVNYKKHNLSRAQWKEKQAKDKERKQRQRDRERESRRDPERTPRG
jgi:hypothetical protein